MGWDWSKKLGTERSAPARPAPFAPSNLPRGMGIDHGATIEHYLERRNGPQPEYAPTQVIEPDDVYLDPNGQSHVSDVVWKWKGDPKGGAKETAQTGNCPECNSPRYFSRTNGPGHMMMSGQMAYPMPECADCGYPRQQGNVDAIAHTQGPNMRSRQGDAPAPAGSLAWLRK